MHQVLTSTSKSPLFTVTAAPYLLLDTELRIVTANPAYLRATRRDRDELTGTPMFDAFPDNPADTTATGVTNLTASLEHVLRRAAAHQMGLQRYDITTTDAPEEFTSRTWVPVNSPLTDPDGRVVGLLHHVEDVTTVHDTLTGALPADSAALAPATLRDLVLLAARYRTALTQPGTPLADPAPGITRRDWLWHRVVHAARDARPGGCAAALCAAAADELPGADAVLTVYGSGTASCQLAAASTWAQHLEELQQITGEGPSLDAYTTTAPVHTSDLAGDTMRWPGFTDAVRGHAAAIDSFPLRTASVTLGTLTFYRREPGPLPAAQLADARAFADMATVVLLADTGTDIAEHIATSADDLHIAVGVLAAALNISTDEAHARLRATAYTTGRTLTDTARDTLARHLRPPRNP